MYPNFAEILKPWPIRKDIERERFNEQPIPLLSAEITQLPVGVHPDKIVSEFNHNPQSVLFGLHDGKRGSDLIARLLVRWQLCADYAIPKEAMPRVAGDLGEFLQGQLLALGLDHIRISTAEIFSRTHDGYELRTWVIGKTAFESGYDSIKHSEAFPWGSGYKPHVRNKKKSPAIVPPPAREPILD